MKIQLKNIAKVKEADIEIKGITVIAGKNDTGKSTIGKSLYAIFNSFKDVKNQISSAKHNGIINILSDISIFFHSDFINNSEMSEKILESFSNSKMYENDFKIDFKQIVNQYADLKIEVDDFELYYKKMVEFLNVSDDEIFISILQKRINSEFNNEINNVFLENDGEIVLTIKDKAIRTVLKENKVFELKNSINLKTDALYIDDPYVIDNLSFRFFVNSYGHREQLLKKLHQQNSEENIIEEIVINKRFENIRRQLELTRIGSTVNQKPKGLRYQLPGRERTLNLKNLSTGLKTFVVINQLLTNGHLEENGTIILDEPEIHLHPEWQLVFAELIVLLHKELNMHVLLTSHSPYFIRAIQVYAGKHEIADKCKYYLAQNQGDVSLVNDVSDDVEQIYNLLAQPLQELENVRSSDE